MYMYRQFFNYKQMVTNRSKLGNSNFNLNYKERNIIYISIEVFIEFIAGLNSGTSYFIWRIRIYIPKKNGFDVNIYNNSKKDSRNGVIQAIPISWKVIQRNVCT